MDLIRCHHKTINNFNPHNVHKSHHRQTIQINHKIPLYRTPMWMLVYFSLVIVPNRQTLIYFFSFIKFIAMWIWRMRSLLPVRKWDHHNRRWRLVIAIKKLPYGSLTFWGLLKYEIELTKITEWFRWQRVFFSPIELNWISLEPHFISFIRHLILNHRMTVFIISMNHLLAAKQVCWIFDWVRMIILTINNIHVQAYLKHAAYCVRRNPLFQPKRR